MDAEHQQHGRGLRAIVCDLESGSDMHYATPRVAPSGSAGLSGDSQVICTSTVKPRLSDGKPDHVPHIGTACIGSRATATRIKSRLPTMPLVGSNSIQPAPGM